MTRAVIALFVAACSGGSKPAPMAPAIAAPPATLTLAEGRVTLAIAMQQGTATSEIAFKTDGTVAFTKPGRGGPPKVRTATLTGDGELRDDTGKLIAKLDDAGTVSVLSVSITKENGQEVTRREKWNALGSLDADGVMTLNKDGSKVGVAAGGQLTGFPPDLTITVDGTSQAARRIAVYLTVASLGSSTVITDSSGPTSAAPPPASTPTK